MYARGDVTATNALVAGSRIADRFELIEVVGRRRWLAKDTSTKASELVSISFDDDESRARARYARLVTAYEKAGAIVPAPIAIGAVGDGRFYLARRWLDEKTAHEQLAFGALPIGVWVPMIRQLLHRLASLHYYGVIHGGLTPKRLTLDGVMLGLDRSAPDGSIDDVDPRYLSPEQLRREPPSPLDDLWAVGMIVFECAMGRPYFQAPSKHELVAAVVKAPLPSPSQRAVELGLSQRAPLGLDDWFCACISRVEDRRYRDAQEAVDAFIVLIARRYERASPGDFGPCLEIAVTNEDPSANGPPVPCLYAPAPQACLNIPPPKWLDPYGGAMPCLSPARLKYPPPEVGAVPCLSVAPKVPPNAPPEIVPAGDGGPYRTVFRPATDHERAARKRRYAAYVGVAVTAALVAIWFARRC